VDDGEAIDIVVIPIRARIEGDGHGPDALRVFRHHAARIAVWNIAAADVDVLRIRGAEPEGDLAALCDFGRHNGRQLRTASTSAPGGAWGLSERHCRCDGKTRKNSFKHRSQLLVTEPPFSICRCGMQVAIPAVRFGY